ncbi:GtrA family protein [Solimicrobium silvestre]|uniref:Putative membrane protein n=1 Tax=Solimicrobium silvestre TaxID=2099400 RepID=A0A2S9H1V5_9BURK|nr:GtrA family protein [Solimicrobium silvestre]PRC93971.1 putative membrane protein [Solimicrobium silvestre]
MIKRELGIFLIVGSLTVLVDFGAYRSLVWLEVAGVDMAKAIGFLAGTVFAYFANRFWTFGHKSHASGSLWRFVILYGITLGANVLVNSLALKLFADATDAVHLAFLLATGVSATLNFLGMKLFVFKPRATSGLT